MSLLTMPRHRAPARSPRTPRTPRTAHDPRPIRTGGIRLGMPPKRVRPGTWSPGTLHDVRVAVTRSAADAALVAFFTSPSPSHWSELITAQVTAAEVR